MAVSAEIPGQTHGASLNFKTEATLLASRIADGFTAFALDTQTFYCRAEDKWEQLISSASYGLPLQTLNDLRAVPPESRSDKQQRLVEDPKANYFFDAEGSGTDNGDTIIEPDVGTGIWYKIIGAPGGGGPGLMDNNVWTGTNEFQNTVTVTSSPMDITTGPLRIAVTGPLSTPIPGAALSLQSTATINSAAGMELLSGTDATSAIVFSDTDEFSRGAIVYDQKSDYMSFVTAGGGNERMRIDELGSVGIGGIPVEGAQFGLFKTDGGFLLPSVTSVERDAFAATPSGSMIYNSTLDKLQGRWGSQWRLVGDCVLSDANDFENVNNFLDDVNVDGGAVRIAVTGSLLTPATGAALALQSTAAAASNSILEMTAGNAGFSAIAFSDTDDVSQGSISYEHTGDILTISTNGANQRIGIESDGSVGIGPSTVSDVALALTSVDGGFLPNTVTTTERDAFAATPNGLIIYNATANTHEFRQNGAWVQIEPGAASLSGTNSWTGANTFTAGLDSTSTNSVRIRTDGNALTANTSNALLQLQETVETTSVIQFQKQSVGTANAGIWFGFDGGLNNDGVIQYSYNQGIMSIGVDIGGVGGTRMLMSADGTTIGGDDSVGDLPDGGATLKLEQTNNPVLQLRGGVDNTSSIWFGDVTDFDVGIIDYDHSSDDMNFYAGQGAGGGLRMTIGTGPVIMQNGLDISGGNFLRVGDGSFLTPIAGQQITAENGAGTAGIGIRCGNGSRARIYFGDTAAATEVEFRWDTSTQSFAYNYDGNFHTVSASGYRMGAGAVVAGRQLELTSTTSLLVLNRLTTTERDALPAGSETAGALFYNTTLNKLQVYTGSGWETVTSV